MKQNILSSGVSGARSFEPALVSILCYTGVKDIFVINYEQAMKLQQLKNFSCMFCWVELYNSLELRMQEGEDEIK